LKELLEARPETEVRATTVRVPKVRVDLHSHSMHSPDCRTEPSAILARCRAVGLSRLAVTDHDSAEGGLALQWLDPELGIVGQECTTQGGDVIGLFVKETIPRLLSLPAAVAAIKEQGGLVYVPHVADRFRNGVGAERLAGIVDDVDILEVFNARCPLQRFNREAAVLAQRYSLVPAAGSDAHAAVELGDTYMLMEPFDGPADFLQKLRDATWVGRPSSQARRLWLRIRRSMTPRAR
jgi:predicted metal-dependent phosphoesterase TrpH